MIHQTCPGVTARWVRGEDYAFHPRQHNNHGRRPPVASGLDARPLMARSVCGPACNTRADGRDLSECLARSQSPVSACDPPQSGTGDVKSLPEAVAPNAPRREGFLARSEGLTRPAGDVALLRPQLPAAVMSPARHGGVILGSQHGYNCLDLGPKRERSIPHQRCAAASVAMA